MDFLSNELDTEKQTELLRRHKDKSASIHDFFY